MTTMPQPASTPVTVGVDTHAEVHVAVAKDSFGRRLDTTSVPTTPAGYGELLGWPSAWARSRPGESRAPAASGLD